MNDPVRDWLRQLLAAELGHRQGDQMLQAAIVGRGWPAMQPFGPREVVAVLQDMYAALRPRLGEARADKWVESATQAFAEFMQSGTAPAATPRAARQSWSNRPCPGADAPTTCRCCWHGCTSKRRSAHWTPSGSRPS
ncbi:hypothetical protein MF271_04575 [Deinococcus sp. KNUC1210]|uniref:hypothetical protein n=1 Tax=Deinococcus sp. KNUC1210 TaxID=2917691 RepID=UPI001EF1534B|nr:hypothetical protein [Deinococcus sp. KNUC1210]ULH15909.1 hypothetical protein MF271_04575 [Deinococcus sp. KNUC1210]